MRSHAKASSAGSNSGRGKGLGSLLVLLILVAACFVPGSALALETRQKVEAFGSDGTSGTNFAYPNAIAFDQGNDRLYALDQIPAQIYGFDASTPATHMPLGGSFPIGAPGTEPFWTDGLAADGASHNLYFASEAKAFFAEPALFGFDSTGAALAGFPIGGFSTSCGVAVDTSGDIWVGDKGAKAVKGFNPSGAPIGSIDTSAQGSPCHVAFDSNDNLYANLQAAGTWKYTAASGYTTATKVDSATGSLFAPSLPIAVDRTTDHLYVATPSKVRAYDETGALLYEFGGDIAGADYRGIAIDEGGERAYLSDLGNTKVQVFGPAVPLPAVTTEDPDTVADTTATLSGTVNPEGLTLTDCRFEYGPTSAYGESAPCIPAAASIPADSNNHPVSADLSDLTPGTEYHFRLVAETADVTAAGPDRTFLTAIGAPTIVSQSVESVGVSDVILSAKINPKGAKTTYRVEYGTTASYGQSTPESAPIGFGGDDSAHTVSVHVGDLDPGTAYHFRFVATSLAGVAEGTDTTFATHPTIPSFDPCANDRFRTGFGARLPDCRAYEQATPVDKHGANVQGDVNLVQASSAGDRVSFYLLGGLPVSGGSGTVSAYIASRGSAGWSTDGVLPPSEPGNFATFTGWSDDLSTVVGYSLEPIAGASSLVDLYLRDTATATFQFGLVNTAPKLAAFAADSKHLIFESNSSLLPGVPAAGNKLYELDNGVLTLAGRVPAGSATSCDDVSGPACVIPAAGSYAGPPDGSGGATGGGYTQNTLSRDGTKVFFVSRDNNQLYLREDGARTTQVSASQKTNGTGPGGTDPAGPKSPIWMASTPSGSETFFTSREELTNDANTGPAPALGLANLDGTSANHTFIDVPAASLGVAVDGTHIYWINPTTNSIGRSNLDGTGVDQNFITGASNPKGVAVDGSFIYWTNAATGANGAGTIGRANLDGTSPNQSFITGANNPQGIDVDGSFVYWANNGTTTATKRIARANLDGTSPDQSFITVTSAPVDVAVNATHIHWTTGSAIGRATITGASPVANFITGNANINPPRGLALDGSFIYWANGAPTPAIGRANLDGTGANKNLISANAPQGIAVDGGHIYWGGSNAADAGNDLYSYDTDSGELTDISVSDPANPKGADVLGVAGVSDDGSYVYFVANGVLAPGASPGNCVDSGIANGNCNLYLTHDGTTTFIATLAKVGTSGDVRVWIRRQDEGQKYARVAADGSAILFGSVLSLTGYPNAGKRQFYRYSATEDELTCVSCNPAGTPPSGEATLGTKRSFLVGGNPQSFLTRNLSADGNRAFFESPDALLPTDTNGVTDVYEWEAEGSGSCETAGGCLYLLSSGTSPDPSWFGDASRDGDHALFFTSQQLVPGDKDRLYDIYDTGVGAGLIAQHALTPPTCAGVACQSNPPPPPEQTPASALFKGPGNVKEGSTSPRKCPKGKRKVRRAGKVRCLKRKQSRKERQRRKQANANRGGSK